MNYIQLRIAVSDPIQKEQCIALLGEEGFEGFEETEAGLDAFVAEDKWDEAVIRILLSDMELSYEQVLIPPTNWNARWESDFEPVKVGDFCTIRAHFHPQATDTRYEIVITPKMSFGTGHHATTRLMIEEMADMDLQGARVLDFGTGTGVLAIMAEKLGAASLDAIDNDEWSFENAIENIQLNDCHRIHVSMTDIRTLASGYDVILANINRHILLEYMPDMYKLLSSRGVLLMSGLLTEDEFVVSEAAVAAGFRLQRVRTLNNWISIFCTKV